MSEIVEINDTMQSSAIETAPVVALSAAPVMSIMEQEALRERLYIAQLKQCSRIVHREQKYARETFRRLFQSQELLIQLFQLFDHDRDKVLVQDDWIEFLKQRVTNEKQIDFVEQVESVAFCLCGEANIERQQFIQIFQAKGVVDKLFRVVDDENAGTVSSDHVMDFLSTITNIRPRTGFDKTSLDRLETLFRQTVGNEKEIRREEFKNICTSKNPFFTERVFQIFDKDDSGSISLQEFLDAMHQFAGQSPDDKIKFLFKVYDLDGDGLIQHRELQHVMRACMEENGMQFSEEQIEDLTVAMFEDADPHNQGTITYEALKHQLEKHGGLLENLSISIDRWLVPPKPQAPAAKKAVVPYYLSLPYMKNNYIYLTFLAVFMLVNVALFVSRAIQYRRSNWFTILARACGQCLNFNCTFVLVLMLRHSITFLRTRGFSTFLPLDHHIYLHRFTGFLIFGFSIFHTIMHVCNFSIIVVNDEVLNNQNFTRAEWLFTSKPQLFGLIDGWANPTGCILILILLVMFLCSQAFVRRGGCFEIFYWTHLMYVPFWILLVLHAGNFWKWFLLPGVVYAIERIIRMIWLKSERGKTYISSGLLLPSKVTHLVIKRPPHFDFHAGDYVFVSIPAIAKYEWHPFTISSAPELEDYIWLHIRGVGQWTNCLFEYFEREQERLHNGEIAPHMPESSSTKKRISNGSIASNNSASNRNPLKIIQAQLTRPFAKKDTNGVHLVGYTNDGFQTTEKSLENVTVQMDPAVQVKDKRLKRLLFSDRTPLEKSLSMPDMQTKDKNRERLLVLKEYLRSESEKSFDECKMRKARYKSLGLAYLSPQNKSLAQSFRYMRNKPTIIAFKTPSLENCEQRDSSSSFGSVGRQDSNLSISSHPESKMEQGIALHHIEQTQLKPVNYPVGKPLEHFLGDSHHHHSPIRPKVNSIITSIQIYLDGPYGTPSSHIFRAQHAVLIATGIGVTPFASILQSIMHRYWKARHVCPKCKFAWSSEIPITVMNLRKVDFFWINRNQRSFEWFVNLLSQLEIEQAELGAAMERFLEMHMYITSALQKTDMKAVGLQLAMDLLHEKEKRDLITGLKTRTNAGRPNWDRVFKQIQDQNKGKVTVFYCGPPQLARVLRRKCDLFEFEFRKEVF